MKGLITMLSFLVCLFTHGQTTDTSFSLVATYNGDVAGAAIDKLDNLYIISASGQIKKIGPKGDSVGVFNGTRRFGKLHAIDVSNPLRPLLFYKDFSTVVLLDRLLANRAFVNLRNTNILQPTAIGLSYDNNIWVFDQYDYKLKKINEAGDLLLQTDDFRTLFNTSFAPQKIINDNGFVYLADSANGIFVFDNYGTYKRKVVLKGWQTVDIWNDRIIRLNKDAIVVYNPANFSEKSLKFPTGFTPYVNSFTTTNKLITFSPGSLRIYRVGY